MLTATFHRIATIMAAAVLLMISQPSAASAQAWPPPVAVQAQVVASKLGGCTEVEKVTVRVVVDYHGWSGPGQFGVVTAYCLNPNLAWACPSYNTALNV